MNRNVGPRARQGLLICSMAISLILNVNAASHADLVAMESFNYSPPSSNLSGNGGAGSFGFSGNWTGNQTFDIASGNLTSPVSPFPVYGNSVTAVAIGQNRDVERLLTQPLGFDNTTTYFSFLMQAEGVVGDGADDGWFAFVLRAGQRNLTVGKDSFHDFYKVEGYIGDTALSTVPVVANQTHLIVLRADFNSGADVFRIFIDTQTGQPEPGLASATLSSFDLGVPVTTIGLSGPGAFGFDELRIGTTWADVTPVPEPKSIAMLSLGVIGLLIGRRMGRPRSSRIGQPD